MSARDAVGRRRNAVETLIRNMGLANEGWTLDQMVAIILREYGYGIRDKTATAIIEQLTRHKKIYRRGSRWFVYSTEKQSQ